MSLQVTDLFSAPVLPVASGVPRSKLLTSMNLGVLIGTVGVKLSSAENLINNSNDKAI